MQRAPCASNGPYHLGLCALQLAYLELLSQLAARLELIESAEEDEEEEESYANDTEHDLAAAAGAGASGALADVEAAA